MLDSVWSYSYPEALRVGQAIQDLGYFWYEDPLPDHDIHGYQRLARHLSIPLLATEITPGGLTALPAWITAGATDFLRGDVVIKGGITGLMKIAHLAEAFGMNCEVHDSYNALNNVAARHVMMAIDNCDWLEVLAFNRARACPDGSRARRADRLVADQLVGVRRGVLTRLSIAGRPEAGSYGRPRPGYEGCRVARQWFCLDTGRESRPDRAARLALSKHQSRALAPGVACCPPG
jgi:hypothetical protein